MGSGRIALHSLYCLSIYLNYNLDYHREARIYSPPDLSVFDWDYTQSVSRTFVSRKESQRSQMTYPGPYKTSLMEPAN